MDKLPPSTLYIAEVSANHLGSLDRAKEIVKSAATSGANAVKFQTYTADTMTLDLPQFSVSKKHDLWGGKNLYKLYEEAHTPWSWHSELFKLARDLGLIPFSSPFDLSALDFLEKLETPIYKIASLETGDFQLLDAVARTGKPVIMSTGATEWEELEEAVEVLRSGGNKDLTLLLCTSSYPADPRDIHLRRMSKLSKAFNCKVGLSDHTLGVGTSIAAIALGATAIEKHLTLRREDGGPDGAFSMEPEEFATLVEQGKIAAEAIGEEDWQLIGSEYESRRLRRSLYVIKDVMQDQTITRENVRSIRPAGGIKPKYLDQIIGKTFARDLVAGTPVSLELIKKEE
jgi:N-acetylneuraminate synthase